jgi:hypothetical protein
VQVGHRSSCVFSKGQTLCLDISVLDGNGEFPSIATKTRPANDALMVCTLTSFWLHMLLFWLRKTATTSICLGYGSTKAECVEYCICLLISDTAMLSKYVHCKPLSRAKLSNTFLTSIFWHEMAECVFRQMQALQRLKPYKSYLPKMFGSISTSSYIQSLYISAVEGTKACRLLEHIVNGRTLSGA